MNADEAVSRLTEVAVLDAGYSSDGFYGGRKMPVHWYERRLLDVLPSIQASSYHEIGGGIGFLPILLGLLGYNAINIDSYAARIQTGNRILASLGDSALCARVRMLLGIVPDVFDEIETHGACAVSTNIGISRPDDFVEAYLRSIQQHYSTYVFDVCLLWGIHRTPEAWQGQLAKASGIWRRDPELLFSIDNSARYYIVRFTAPDRARSQRRPKTAAAAAGGKSTIPGNRRGGY